MRKLYDKIFSLCPIDGLSKKEDGSFKIFFKNEATSDQRANAINMAISGVPDKVTKPLATLINDYNMLSSGDKYTLQAAISMQYLRSDPGFAKSLGINLDGEI